MASGILLQYSEHGIPRKQTVAHDLESFIYVFIYICVMYDGPGNKLRDNKLFNQTVIGRWIYGEWDAIGLIKQQHLEQPDLIISDITPYFQPFSTLISKLCSLLSEQVNYMKTLDGHGTTPTINSPLMHTQLINTIRPAIDDDDHDEPLSLFGLRTMAPRKKSTANKENKNKESEKQGTRCLTRENRGNGGHLQQMENIECIQTTKHPRKKANPALQLQPVNMLAPQPAKCRSKPQACVRDSPAVESEASHQSHDKQPVNPSRHLTKPRGQYGFTPPAARSAQHTVASDHFDDDKGTKPDEDWDGDDGYDNSLRPDGNDIDGEAHDQEYNNEEGGWDDGMNGPGDANDRENADEPFGLSGMDVDRFLDLANCHAGPGTPEVDDPRLRNPLIDVQDNQYLMRTDIGRHQLQPLTATLSIDPPIVLILGPTYHPTIVNGMTVTSSPNNSLPTATTVAVLLSLKHNRLVAINVVMSFFSTKKGMGVLAWLDLFPLSCIIHLLNFWTSRSIFAKLQKYNLSLFKARDLLEKAKKRSRLESLDNSFPHHETFLAEDAIEILAELHNQFAAEGHGVEEGYWESYKHNMAIILWDDLGNMRFEFKKAARPIVQSRYELFHEANEIEDNDDAMEHIRNGIKDLQDEAKFL
ncbi:hypothetical protein BDR03DRAFT_988142 [Suillus americanus]|nr:hypothetical protein BDR03DRAFT_988142 [Suillus americanus]